MGNHDKIKVLIDNGPVTPDYKGGSRGWSARLLLDPEAREVTLYTCIGAGIPSTLYYRTVTSLSINEAAAGEALAEILESDEAQAIMSRICDAYEGEVWDGHNHVGKWAFDPDGHPACEADEMRLEAMLEEAACYWDADAWFDPAWSECKQEIRTMLSKDGDVDENLRDLADEWTDTAAREGALLDLSDVLDVITSMREELAEEAEVEDEEDDR